MGKSAMKGLELILVAIKSLIPSVLVLLKLGTKLERESSRKVFTFTT